MSSAPDLSKLRGAGSIKPRQGPDVQFNFAPTEEDKQRLEQAIQ
jgi:hypothetical protein